MNREPGGNGNGEASTPSPRYSGTSARERAPRARSFWLALALGASLLFWASAFAAIRVGLKGYSPQSLALLRFLSGSVGVGLMAAVLPIRRPTRRELGLLVPAALAGIPIYHVSLNWAEVSVGAGPAALLINISPVMAALLATTALRERLGVAGWVGTFVSFAGAAVIALSNGWSFDPRAVGVLVAAVAGAAYTVLQKPLLRSFSPMAFTAWAVWIGTICLLPLLPRLLHEFRTAPASATWAGLYMGIFPTALAYAMWANVISRMNVSRAVSFLYLVPALAVCIAWLWLGEVPSVVALLGGALIVAGVVLVNAAKAPPAPPPAPTEVPVRQLEALEVPSR
jgi:drug/metabolite transporter (DMT)-like permease